MPQQPDQENRPEPLEEEMSGSRTVVDFDPGRPFHSYLAIVYMLVADPRAFFWAMSVDGGYKQPWLFAVLSVLIPWLGVVIFYQSSILWALYPMALLGIFIFAGMIHFSSTKLMGGRASFQATFRVVAYTSFTIILGPIPYLGLAAHIFGLYLTAHGVAAVHRLSLLRGAAAVIIIEGALRLLQYQMMGQMVTGQ